MSFLSSDDLKASGGSLVSPFSVDRVKHGAYELSVGDEYYATSMKLGKKVVGGSGEQIRIPPGQLALLITREAVTLPESLIAFISMKFGPKMKGLVNVSGFHVDPGFSGKLKFSVYNAGSEDFFFDVGQPLFLIWFAEMRKGVEAYNGKHQDQHSISANDVSMLQGDVASPSQLNDEIKSLANKVNILTAIFAALVAAALGPIIGYWLELLGHSTGESPPKAPAQSSASRDGGPTIKAIGTP